MQRILLFLVILFLSISVFAQREHPVRPTPSGGPLLYEQAAYDVKKYDITATVNPADRSISGTTLIEATVVAPTRWILVDLDSPFQVSAVRRWDEGTLVPSAYERSGERIRIEFEQTKQPGEKVVIAISYSGKPRIAPNPPWVGGFMWEKTEDGSDWIVVACQNDGSDLWYPSKDHPSDEPDSVSLHITVPEQLYVATVGKLVKIEQNSNNTRTFHWSMSNPVNNYNVVLNIAPYQLVTDSYKSIAGEEFPIIFYALPESAAKARDIVEQTKTFLGFYEKFAGPYPYRVEKLGIAETPHLGMEHSTIIAYGNKFKKDGSGFDWLMLHELGHEWWGNMVTASDWRDMWIHEGFQSFFDSLYIEQTKGRSAYLNSMRNKMKATKNKQAVAPREPRYAYQIYFLAPDYTESDGDIYGKGAAILHTLRYLIGDEAFFRAVRRMAYPERRLETITTGKQNRLVTTDDFKQIAEEESKMDLDWFFEVYLRQPALPSLSAKTSDNKLTLSWDVPNGLEFPMPVEIEAGGEKQRIDFEGNSATIDWSRNDLPVFDREGWILRR